MPKTPLESKNRAFDAGVWLLYASLAILCVALIANNAGSLISRIAIGGWSLIDWVNHRQLPGNFSLDFSSGIHTYSFSLFISGFGLLADLVGHPAEWMLQTLVGVEVIALCVAVVLLCRAIPGCGAPSTVLVVACLTMASYFGYYDLSRTGKALFYGLYYEAADAARLAAIALYIAGRWRWSAVLLIFAICTHPILGGLAGLFLLTFALFEGRNIVWPRLLRFFGLVGIVSMLWLLRIPSEGSGVEPMATDLWISASRIFNSHWYAFDLGLFDERLAERVLPLLMWTGLMLLFSKEIIPDPKFRERYVAAVALLIALGFFGAIASGLVSWPPVIKLNLQRASMLGASLAAPVVIAGLMRLMGRGLFGTFGAWAILLAPFYDYAIFPVGALALVLLDKAQTTFTQFRLGRVAHQSMLVWALGAVGSTAFVLTLIYIPALRVGCGEYNTALMLGSERMWLLAAILGAITALLRYLASHKVVYGSVAAALLCAALFWNADDAAVKRRGVETERYYREAQDWARMHTSTDALFFVDPMVMYGWRDFSQRASFGNVREWLHTSSLYESNGRAFASGLRRFEEFGLTFSTYLAMPVKSAAANLYGDLDKAHYAKSDAWRLDLSRKYCIRYHVLKAVKARESRLPVVFSNGQFVILDVGDSRGLHSAQSCQAGI